MSKRAKEGKIKMNFNEKEIIATAMIGFDMIEGPSIKWYRQFLEREFNIDMQSFLMNFYLSFRGGDENLQPRAILYPNFYIVAFPRGLELCCLFMQPENLQQQLNRLNQIANELMNQMDQVEEERANQNNDPELENEKEYSEIKRIVVNLLNGQEISTPELRRYFKLSNSEIWQIMSQLEEINKVIRTQKVGRTQYWTAVMN
jgi:uncharacterized membrane protein